MPWIEQKETVLLKIRRHETLLMGGNNTVRTRPVQDKMSAPLGSSRELQIKTSVVHHRLRGWLAFQRGLTDLENCGIIPTYTLSWMEHKMSVCFVTGSQNTALAGLELTTNNRLTLNPLFLLPLPLGLKVCITTPRWYILEKSESFLMKLK